VATSFTGRSVLAGVERQAEGPGDLLVVKLDPRGKAVWSAFATRGDFDAEDGHLGLAVDPAGRVTVAGAFYQTMQLGAFKLTAGNDHDAFVARIGGGGDSIWVIPVTGPSFGSATGVVLDAAGNAYVSGWHNGTTHFGDHAIESGTFWHAEQKAWLPNWRCWLAKVNVAGQFEWAAQVDWSKSACMAVTVEAKRALLTGAAGDPATTLVAAHDLADGKPAWIVDALAEQRGRGEAIARDASGVITVVGRSDTYAGSSDLFVSRLDAEGHLLASPRIVGGGGADLAHAVTVDERGNLHIAGSFGSSALFGEESRTAAGGTDLFVWKVPP
jgi:hypothetical protein